MSTSLLDRIKADSIQARKDRAPTSGVLITLLGEVSTRQKDAERGAPDQPLADAEIIPIVKKFLKNNGDAIEAMKGACGERVEAGRVKLGAERAALEAYLPQQMVENEIESFVRAKIAAGVAGMGPLMAALKTERSGLYDGKLASVVVKRVISG